MRLSIFAVAAWACMASTAFSQRIYFGFIGGTNLSGNFPVTETITQADAYGNPANDFRFLNGGRSAIFGASVEVQLYKKFSIEGDVLRRPMNSTMTFTDFSTNPAKTTTYHETAVDAWEFPLLLKYALPVWKSTHPFLAAGVAFRAQENAFATELSQIGAQAAAGVGFDVWRLRISPQVRYTRWVDRNIYPKYATRPDQFEFLTSIAYRTESGSRHLAGRELELGAIAGLPATPNFSRSYGYRPRQRFSYLVGVTVQARVTPRLSIEANGIYKPLRGGSDGTYTFSVLTWEFPVLAKYRFGQDTAKCRTFVEAGPSFRLAGNLNGYNPSHAAATVGGGIETRSHGVLLSPALRFTRWAKDQYPYAVYGSRPSEYPRTDPNGLELVFGASF